MRFMISSSDRALVRADFRRFWPLLFGYAVLWLCVLPLGLWSRRGYLTPRHPLETMVSVNDYLSGVTEAATIISACFAVLLAMALFSYLMNSRSVGLMHSLPITRGRQFAVHFAVGVVMFTVVHVAAALISLPVQASLGAVDFRSTMEWLAVAEMTSLFFFALATLCAMITGWLLAIPVIYAGVNFLFAVFYLLYYTITQMFYWGVENIGWPTWLSWLTPAVRMVAVGSFKERMLYGTDGEGVNHAEFYVNYLTADAWKNFLIYTAVALLLIATAYLFCRARHSETAGDAIVFSWLRPVVLYVIALAGGLGIGILLWYLVADGRGLLSLLLCQIVSGLVVFFGVRMLLHKSFKVFDRRGWLGAAALTAALAVICLFVRLDVFGVQKYVPDVDQIASVDVMSYSGIPSVEGLSDPAGLEKATALHKAILEQGQPGDAVVEQYTATPTGEYTGDETYPYFSFTYQMKDGSVVRRSYDQFVRRGTPLYEACNDFYNAPSVREKRVDWRFDTLDRDPATITGGWFNNYRLDAESAELTGAQARRLYTALEDYWQAKQQEPVDVLDRQEDVNNCCFYLEFLYTEAPAADGSTDESSTEASWSVDALPGDCTEVLDLLVSYGLAKDVSELLYDNK